jgi:hypothetical protein
MRNVQSKGCAPPLSRFSDFEGKAAILNCGRNTLFSHIRGTFRFFDMNNSVPIPTKNVKKSVKKTRFYGVYLQQLQKIKNFDVKFWEKTV